MWSSCRSLRLVYRDWYSLLHKNGIECLSILSVRQFGNSNVYDLIINMPKIVDNSSLRGSRHEHHVQLTEKARPASEVYLQVVGNGSNGSSKSLYVFTDQWKYIFNCGEGTQRLTQEYKPKLANLKHVLFTHRSWSNFGGLPGLILTIQSIGVPEITIHGPKGIKNLFEMTKGFMLTDDVEIIEKSIDDKEHSDHLLKIQYVPLYGGVIKRSLNMPTEESPENVSDYYDHIDSKRSVPENASNTLNPSKKLKFSFDDSDKDISVAYICQPTQKQGVLSLEKCIEFGVPPGPLLGHLKDGKDVVLQNGTVVRSVDVVRLPDPSPIFIVLECPSDEFLDGLLEAPEFIKHQKDTEKPEDLASVVVHFTPSNVVKTNKYQQWIERFSPSTTHLYLNDVNNSLSSVAVHKVQHHLNLVHPTIFPLLKEKCSSNLQFEVSGMHIQCPTMLRYYLRPHKKIQPQHIPDSDPQSFIAECNSLTEFQEELSKLKIEQAIEKPKQEGVATRRYPEVLFLGTGSSVPGKIRNTSGILVNLSDDKSLLLDCGEGTYIQLFRFAGEDDIDDTLLKIKAIFISHLHADHHIGLIEVLQKRKIAATRRNVICQPLDLIAPAQIMFWLKCYHEMFEPILDNFRLVPNRALLHNATLKYLEYESLLSKLDLKEIVTSYARHCLHAYSVAISYKDGWKIVYSGDTMPCHQIITIGKGCDLLIHEATMEDELKTEAVLKRHSTTSGAIEQGIKMEAKFTILTHFSQRYAKIPHYTNKLSKNVGFAFDYMRVSLDDLNFLSQLVPAIEALFVEECEDMAERTAKRLKKINRQKLQLENKSRSINLTS